MSTADTTCMAAADDMRGRHVAVYHNAGHVRVEIGEAPHRADVDLTVEAARVILNGLADAALEARLWELEQAAADTAELEEVTEYRQAEYDVYLPITYDADDTPHIRRPHTTHAGAWKHAEELAISDLNICRFEVATMEMIVDA